jgi:hypothetical protein
MPGPTQSELSEDTLPASLFAIRPADLKNDSCPNGRSSVGERAFIPLGRFLIIFCIGVSAALAWLWYGAREMVESSYPQLTGLAPRAEPVVQTTPDVIGLASRADPSPDQQQPNAMLLDLDAVRQSIDQIATSIASSQGRMTSSADRMATTQEQIAGSIDRMATTQEQIARSADRIATSQEHITRSIDQLAANQEQTTRSIDQIATSIAASLEQMTRSTNQTATIGQSPSAKVGGVAVESRDDAALQPAARLNIKPTEAKPLEKQLSAASAYDPSCFPSASAVVQNYPGSSPSWTMRAPGHEGTKCWRAATRTRESDQ